MTPSEQSAYERGRADERAAVVSWLRAYGRNSWDKRPWQFWRWWAYWAASVALKLAAEFVENEHHLKGTDNG